MPHRDEHQNLVWVNVERWADTLELAALSDMMDSIDRGRWKGDEVPAVSLNDAEASLRPIFYDCGATVTVYEEIVKHPMYETKTCVVGIVESKVKVKVVVRAESWREAIEKAHAYAMKSLWNPVDSRQRQPEPPKYAIDTDAVRVIEPGASGAEPPDDEPEGSSP
jgi:hypothetical protein